MPLYEYQCDACGHRFEVIQKFSDPPIEVCPTCGGVVAKLLSSPAIQFKGSGWYITDYARAGKPDTGAGSNKKDSAGASGDASSPASSAAKPDTKADTKTETKATAASSTSD